MIFSREKQWCDKPKFFENLSEPLLKNKDAEKGLCNSLIFPLIFRELHTISVEGIVPHAMSNLSNVSFLRFPYT